MAERDAAIARRDFFIGIDRKAALLQHFPRTSEEKLIRKTAAGEKDARQAEALRRGEDHRGDDVWLPARLFVGRDPVLPEDTLGDFARVAGDAGDVGRQTVHI